MQSQPPTWQQYRPSALSRVSAVALAPALALALPALSSCSSNVQPGHTFEIIEEDGIPVAVSSAIPRYDGELFTYEKLLVIRPDPGNDDSLLYRPSSFTLGDDGNYYVADSGNNRVAVFDGEGNFVRAFGREGQGPGELQNPVFVEVRDGVVYVFGDRTSLFRTDGTYVNVAGAPPGRFVRPLDGGRFLVEDTTRANVDGERYVGARARVIDPSGEVLAGIETAQARSSPLLQYSAAPAVFLAPAGEILATSGTEPTLSWYDLDGELKRKARIDLPLEPVMDEDRAAVDELWDRIVDHYAETRGADAAQSLRQLQTQTSYPETKAYWRRPLLDDGGWLWLPAAVADAGLSLPGAAPVESRTWFRIVDPRGEFIGTTEWPSEVTQLQQSVIAGGRLLTMVWDEEAAEMLPTVYRIHPVAKGLVYP